MTDAELIAALSDEQVVGLTLYGEARGEWRLGRIGVANTIANRAAAQKRRWGLTAREVCLRPYQYSCWMVEGGLANYEDVIAAARTLTGKEPFRGPVMADCLDIAQAVVAGTLTDVTDGSTHYLTRGLYQSAHCPRWASGRPPKAIIGAHLFFGGPDL